MGRRREIAARRERSGGHGLVVVVVAVVAVVVAVVVVAIVGLGYGRADGLVQERRRVPEGAFHEAARHLGVFEGRARPEAQADRARRPPVHEVHAVPAHVALAAPEVPHDVAVR